jgi:hypothetical protein
VSEPEWAQV